MTQTFTPKFERTAGGLFVIRLPQTPVNRDRTLEEAIRISAPQTPADYLIWQAAPKYQKPLNKSGIEMVDLNLVGPNSSWGSQEAINICKREKWSQGDPWETYAIQETHPTLHRALGRSFLGAVCLQECKLGSVRLLPYAWWRDDERGAGASCFVSDWFGGYFWVVRGEVQ
jgi:hypothetical protein